MLVETPRTPASAEELEALIREARRRARRRRAGWAAFVLALLAAGAAAYAIFGGGGSPTAPAARSERPQPATRAQELQTIVRAARRATIVEAGLIAPGFGWAMNGIGLWLTEDGGTRWRPIAPPHVLAIGDPVARINQIQFVDRLHGWIAASDTIGGVVPPDHASLRHMEIDRTADGGRSWQWSIPPGCLGPCGGAQISFLDTTHGFALTGGATQPRMYATTDGGVHWALVGRPPFTGSIVFLDRREGFAISDPSWTGPAQSTPAGGGILYRTADGGRQWRRVNLAAPSKYQGQPQVDDLPKFFGARHGVLSARFRDRATGAQHVVVYTTADGGATWIAHLAPENADVRAYQWGVSGATPFSAVSARSWVLFVGDTLYSTRDAGRSWRLLHPRYAPALPRIRDVNFTSLSDGWAIFALPARYGPNVGAALVHTSDGGRDWSPLAPPVPKLPPSRTTSTCGSACRRP